MTLHGLRKEINAYFSFRTNLVVNVGSRLGINLRGHKSNSMCTCYITQLETHLNVINMLNSLVILNISYSCDQRSYEWSPTLGIFMGILTRYTNMLWIFIPGFIIYPMLSNFSHLKGYSTIGRDRTSIQVQKKTIWSARNFQWKLI